MRPLLGSSPQEEAAKQERLIASLAKANRARIAAEINRTMQAMADQYEIGRGLPQLPEGSEARLVSTMQTVAGQAIATFGTRIMDRGKAATLTLGQKGFAEFFARLAAEFIAAEMIRRRITSINETTRDHVMRMIASGQENGDSLEKIANGIRERAPRIARVRAHVIARTETHNAANYGAHHAAKATGLQLVKEWVSVEDHRTRDFLEPTISEFSHRDMNGVQVAMDAPFMVPGLFGKTEPLMYPGDPAGSPGNTINCRCASVHSVLDPEDATPQQPEPTQPPTQPRPRFRYQTIEAPTTVAAMNEFIIANGIAAMADLKGISPKTIGPILKTMLEVKERFDIDPIHAIGPASRFGLKTPRNVNAAVYRVTSKDTGRAGVFHMPTKFGNTDEAERQIAIADFYAAAYNKERADFLNKSHISREVIQRAAKMDEGGANKYRWSISSRGPTGADARMKTIYHEFGHVLHLQNTKNPEMMAELDQEVRYANPRANGWGHLISKYSLANDKEYIAEAFALYMTEPESEHYRIQPKILGVFKKWDKAA